MLQTYKYINYKIFDLDLQNGPYKLNATSKTIYLAGHHGHIASFNWRHKQLECEF